MFFRGLKVAALSLLLFVVSCKKKDTDSNSVLAPTSVDVSSFKGVNWADIRDNFVDGPIVLSGFSINSDRATIVRQSQIVIDGFKNNLGANTVRMPINPQTVLTPWWENYSAAIDVALASDMKVILACWEGAAQRNGFIDDTIQFYNMWHAVVNKYKDNNKVYFEILNEPYGYTTDEWKSICKQWLALFPNLPRSQVLIGGTGYDQFVSAVADDVAFKDCLFSQHAYAFWLPSVNTIEGWQALANASVSPYQNRTILTEFGVPMVNGPDYSQPANGNHEIAFLQAITQYCDSMKMGSCYWPGLRSNDSYSLQLLRNDSMITTNASGVALLRRAWGY